MKNGRVRREATAVRAAGSCLQALVALVLLGAEMREAHAAIIALGSRIELTPTTFALPVEISGAVEASAWFLDLTYDPTDLQVNVNCDPFTGSLYCSLLTGPVTEGGFFAEAAPFNLFIPGFVELDPATLLQTGRLFGMHGAFGGSSAPPSGSGVLAYVEFSRLGTGDSPIGLEGSVTSVPEPGTLALLSLGLLGLGLRRRRIQYPQT